MLVSEIATATDDGTLHALQGFALWHCDIEKLTHVQLLAHYALLKSALGIPEAVKIMQELKGECLLKMMLDEISYAAIIDFRPPVEDLVSPALLPFLRRLTFNERALILVALAEQRPVSELIELTWPEVSINLWSDFSRKVFNQMVPRLGCDYVFWQENSLHHPAPLLVIEDKIAAELNVSWSELARVAETLMASPHFALPTIDSLLNTHLRG